MRRGTACACIISIHVHCARSSGATVRACGTCLCGLCAKIRRRLTLLIRKNDSSTHACSLPQYQVHFGQPSKWRGLPQLCCQITCACTNKINYGVVTNVPCWQHIMAYNRQTSTSARLRERCTQAGTCSSGTALIKSVTGHRRLPALACNSINSSRGPWRSACDGLQCSFSASSR